MRLDNLAAQIQPDSRAANAVVLLTEMVFDPKEFFEDPIAGFGRDAWTGIRHRHLQRESATVHGILRGRCQGTRTITGLRDTNCYGHNRSPRTTRGDLPPFPGLPDRGHSSCLPAAA